MRRASLSNHAASASSQSSSSEHRQPDCSLSNYMPTRSRPHARASHRVLFGAAYYSEHQPVERLKTDLDLMADAHFTVIRVGESVWSTWEPENGRFDLDWLQPVLDGAPAPR